MVMILNSRNTRTERFNYRSIEVDGGKKLRNRYNDFYCEFGKNLSVVKEDLETPYCKLLVTAEKGRQKILETQKSNQNGKKAQLHPKIVSAERKNCCRGNFLWLVAFE